MSETIEKATLHLRRTPWGRRCDYCGSIMQAGQQYRKWPLYDGGERGTVYAHVACWRAWMAELKVQEGGAE